MKTPNNQLVRTYKYQTWPGSSAEKKFAKDSAKLLEQGWTVQSHSQSGMYLGHPRSITVVYVRQSEN